MCVIKFYDEIVGDVYLDLAWRKGCRGSVGRGRLCAKFDAMNETGMTAQRALNIFKVFINILRVHFYLLPVIAIGITLKLCEKEHPGHWNSDLMT